MGHPEIKSRVTSYVKIKFKRGVELRPPAAWPFTATKFTRLKEPTLSSNQPSAEVY
jgi:hypothetical protein